MIDTFAVYSSTLKIPGKRYSTWKTRAVEIAALGHLDRYPGRVGRKWKPTCWILREERQ
jgi:hypothetical protein